MMITKKTVKKKIKSIIYDECVIDISKVRGSDFLDDDLELTDWEYKQIKKEINDTFGLSLKKKQIKNCYDVNDIIDLVWDSLDDDDHEDDEINFLSKAKKLFGKVPFIRDVVAMYFCAMDSNTPMYVKGTILGAIAYFVNPMDAIPDALVGLGFTDDASFIAKALGTVRDSITQEHWEKADQFLKRN